MSDELKLKIVLDTGEVKTGFLSLEKSAKQTTDKIAQNAKSSGGFSGLSEGVEKLKGSVLGLVGPHAAAAAAIAFAAKKSFDFALAGEQVNAVNIQFKNLAYSAGLAADSFSDAIVKSTQGLIDDEDALQIASKGIIALGENASKLPAILDASRSVSRGLGKDFKSTFEDLSTFVEVGNAKVLRQYGIVLNLEDAYKKAAKSIGITADQLNEQQKQTIRSNLVLDEIPKKFSAAADSVTPLKDAFDRLKVSVSNSLEAVQSRFASFLTSVFVDKADLSNIGLTRLGQLSKEAADEIYVLNNRINEIQADKLGSKSVQASAELASLRDRLKEVNAERDKLFIQQSAASDNELFAALDASRAPKQSDNPDALKITPEQEAAAAAARAKRLSDLNQFVLSQNKIILDGELKNNESIIDARNRISNINALYDQQQIQLEQDKNLKLAQIDEQFSGVKGFSENQREQAKLAALAAFNQQQVDLETAKNLKIKALQDQANLDSVTGFNYVSTAFSQMAEGFSAAAIDFSNTAATAFKNVGKTALQTIGNGVGQAFAAFGSALASGDDAGQAFLESMLGVFADVAIQLGTSFIMQGIAHSLNPLTPGLGGPLIGAGAALATFGGVLKALSGGKSKASTASDSGGGIASSPSAATELTPTQDLQRQEAGTAVSVVIQGDVLDSEESGSRVVALINQAFDKKGVVINQGALA